MLASAVSVLLLIQRVLLTPIQRLNQSLNAVSRTEQRLRGIAHVVVGLKLIRLRVER